MNPSYRIAGGYDGTGGGQGVIRRGEFGALCMNIPNGLPYGIQISYALDEEANVLYFHETIRDGEKEDIPAYKPPACVTIIHPTARMPFKLGAGFCKVNVYGLVLDVSDEAEKRHGLECNLKKHDRNYLKRSEKYIKNLMKRSRGMKMMIRRFTGEAWVM